MRPLHIKTEAGQRIAELPSDAHHEVVLQAHELVEIIKESESVEAVLEIFGIPLERVGILLIARNRFALHRTINSRNPEQLWKFWDGSIQVSDDNGKHWEEQYANHPERSGVWVLPQGSTSDVNK